MSSNADADKHFVTVRLTLSDFYVPNESTTFMSRWTKR
jgi:hypothetical protein